MIARIMRHLKENEVEAYSPGQKTGKCNSPYVVIKDNGQKSSVESSKVGYKTIDVIIFFPIDRYTQIESYRKEIKKSIKELKFLRATGYESPVIIDDRVKAYTTSIQYQVLKKI